MSCGPWCVYYRDRDKNRSICNNCSDYEDKRSRFELGKVDPFKLAGMLAEEQEKKRRSKIPRLSQCPACHRQSLFYNSTEDGFECLNIDCQIKDNPILAGTQEYKSVLLSVMKLE